MAKPSKEGKFERAWQRLFHDLSIHQKLHSDGYADVTADQIKQITGEEARLMAKWDDAESRPRTLKDHDVIILPVSNGTYRLVRSTNGYTDLSFLSAHEPELYRWPERRDFQTLPIELRSESQVIDVCLASGLLERFIRPDFPDERLTLTVRGRLWSPAFTYTIQDVARRKLSIDVDRVQVELDAGYEGKNCFVIIEAKMHSTDNLITRQLAYPYWMWRNSGVRKPILPIYVGYSNSTLSIVQFEQLGTEYTTLVPLRSAKYVFDDTPPDRTLAEIVASARVSQHERSSPPFPQADSLERVIDTIDLVGRGFRTSQEIADQMQVDPRQGDYYGNGAIYLGMLERHGDGFRLTRGAEQFLVESPRRRFELLASQAVHWPVFHKTAQFAVANKAMPDRRQISDWIREHTGYSRVTAWRRASTVAGWMQPFLRNLR